MGPDGSLMWTMLTLPPPTADTPTLQELETALAALGEGTRPAWGRMTAPQMVQHCRGFVDLYLGDVQVAAPVRWIARLIGPLFLKKVLAKSPLETPKNLGTLPALRAKEGEAVDFEAECTALRAGFQRLRALEGTVRHPLYGKADAETCRALVRHHTAHHFHQFGLLGAD